MLIRRRGGVIRRAPIHINRPIAHRVLIRSNLVNMISKLSEHCTEHITSASAEGGVICADDILHQVLERI
jgi:hypothetical protein